MERFGSAAGSLAERYRSEWEPKLERWRTELAAVVRDSKETPDVVITLLGGTGMGKSTLLNAILGCRLLATSSTQACTAAICDVRHDPDSRSFRAEVEFVPEATWLDEVQAFADALADEWDELPGTDKTTPGGPVADKLLALYGEGLVEKFFDNLDLSELRHDDDLRDAFKVGTVIVEASSADEVRKQLRPYLTTHGRFWPIVKGVRVTGPFSALPRGVRLVDLPGLNDPNRAREELTWRYIDESSFVWVVYSMKRALTKEITDVLRERDLFRRLITEGREGGLVFVGTSADEIDPGGDCEQFGLDENASYIDIASARAQASTDHVRAQLDELVTGLEDAAEGQAESATQLRGKLHELPVFTVSARDFLHLGGKQPARNPLFSNLAETGIPALIDDLHRTVEQNNAEGHAARVRRRYEAIAGEMDLSISTARARLSIVSTAQGRPDEVKAAAGRAATFLETAASEAVDDFRTAILVARTEFRGQMQAGAERARSRMRSLRTEWRRIHWGTLRATCKAGGRFQGSREYVDLSASAGGPLLDAIALAWADFFGRRLQQLLANAAGAMELIAADYRGELSEELGPVGGHDEHLRQRRRDVQESANRVISSHYADMKASVEDRIHGERSTLVRRFGEGIHDEMQPAYRKAAAERGSGMLDRMVDILGREADHVAVETVPDLEREVGAAVEDLAAWATDRLSQAVDEVVSMAKRLADELVSEQASVTAAEVEAFGEAITVLAGARRP